jgi:hypothetical protein
MSTRGFAAIPNHVIRDSSLPASARLLYGIILSYAFAGRRCTASTARLCDEAGIGRSAFFDAIKVLRTRGLLEVEKVETDRGWRNVYKPVTRELSIEDEGEEASPDIGLPLGGSSAQPDGGSSAQPDAEEDHSQEDQSPNGLLASERSQQHIVASLIDYWKLRCGHPTAKPTRERRQKVVARLREGYTEAEIRRGIDGAAAAAFVNDSGKRFDDLELICRNGSKLESFIERAAVPPARSGNVHPIRQSNGKPSHDQLLAELRAANPRLQAEAARQLPAGP